MTLRSVVSLSSFALAYLVGTPPTLEAFVQLMAAAYTFACLCSAPFLVLAWWENRTRERRLLTALDSALALTDRRYLSVSPAGCGFCSGCGRAYPIGADGRVIEHDTLKPGTWSEFDRAVITCIGSDEPPERRKVATE